MASEPQFVTLNSSFPSLSCSRTSTVGGRTTCCATRKVACPTALFVRRTFGSSLFLPGNLESPYDHHLIPRSLPSDGGCMLYCFPALNNFTKGLSIPSLQTYLSNV